MMKNLFLLFTSFFAMGIVAPLSSAKAEDGWLPLTRTQILRQFEIDQVEEVKVAPGQQVAVDVPPLVAAGDTVWVGFNEKANFRLAIAGRDDRVHSIRVYVPIVNDTKDQSAAMLKKLKSFYSKIFPDWPDASNWPEKSMSSSWAAAALAMEHKPYDPAAIVTSKIIGGITLSTFGVPPDIVLFGATARSTCVPRWDAAHQEINSIQHLVCG